MANEFWKHWPVWFVEDGTMGITPNDGALVDGSSAELTRRGMLFRAPDEATAFRIVRTLPTNDGVFQGDARHAYRAWLARQAPTTNAVDDTSWTAWPVWFVRDGTRNPIPNPSDKKRWGNVDYPCVVLNDGVVFRAPSWREARDIVQGMPDFGGRYMGASRLYYEKWLSEQAPAPAPAALDDAALRTLIREEIANAFAARDGAAQTTNAAEPWRAWPLWFVKDGTRNVVDATDRHHERSGVQVCAVLSNGIVFRAPSRAVAQEVVRDMPRNQGGAYLSDAKDYYEAWLAAHVNAPNATSDDDATPTPNEPWRSWPTWLAEDETRRVSKASADVLVGVPCKLQHTGIVFRAPTHEVAAALAAGMPFDLDDEYNSTAEGYYLGWLAAHLAAPGMAFVATSDDARLRSAARAVLEAWDTEENVVGWARAIQSLREVLQ